MKNATAKKEWVEMRDNIRRAVHSLEVCWKCQNVSECHKYILGHTVLVWLCKACLREMEKPLLEDSKKRRAKAQNFPASWRTFN